MNAGQFGLPFADLLSENRSHDYEMGRAEQTIATAFRRIVVGGCYCGFFYVASVCCKGIFGALKIGEAPTYRDHFHDTRMLCCQITKLLGVLWSERAALQ